MSFFISREGQTLSKNFDKKAISQNHVNPNPGGGVLMGVVVEIIPITSYSINLTVNFLLLQKGEGQLSYQEKGGGF